MHPCSGQHFPHSGCKLHLMQRWFPRRRRHCAHRTRARALIAPSCHFGAADDLAGVALDVGSSTGDGAAGASVLAGDAAADNADDAAGASLDVGSSTGDGGSLASRHATWQLRPCATQPDEVHLRQQVLKPVAAGRLQPFTHRGRVSPRRGRGDRLRGGPCAAGGAVGGGGGSRSSLTVPVSRLAATDGSSGMACLFAASHDVGSGAGVGCSLARCHAALQRGPCSRVTPAEMPPDALHVRQQAAQPVAAGRPQPLIHRSRVSARRCRGDRLRSEPCAAGGGIRGGSTFWPAKRLCSSRSLAAAPVGTRSAR